MASSRIVEAVDVLGGEAVSVVEGIEGSPVHALLLEAREETLENGVVPTVAGVSLTPYND